MPMATRAATWITETEDVAARATLPRVRSRQGEHPRTAGVPSGPLQGGPLQGPRQGHLVCGHGQRRGHLDVLPYECRAEWAPIKVALDPQGFIRAQGVEAVRG